MNISELLKKDPWKRRVTPDFAGVWPTNPPMYYRCDRTMDFSPSASFRLMTQDDFLNEVSPDSHKINEKYYSQRPIWRLETDENGKQNWVIDGYDEVEAVSLGIQQSFIRKYLARFTGNGIWIANETEKDKPFEKMNSWRDIAGLNVAFKELADSCFRTADGAVYWYVTEDGDIEYKVFSYLKGDVLFPQLDENGEEIVVRLYKLMGKSCVEIYSPKYIECWIQFDPNSDKDKTWLQKAKGYLKRAFGMEARSEDGWTRVYRKVSQTGGKVNQCIYVRLNDIPTGCVQSAIENLERAYSYVAENVRGSAFPMLFLAATKFTTLPPMGASPTIGVQGTADDIKAARAEYVAPANMSDIAKLNIDALWSNITKTANIVYVDPEILKSGADSSTTIKIMFAPEVEWAMEMWINFFKPMKQMVEVFKQLVGKVEGNINEYAELRLSCGIEPYIPQNEAEVIQNIVNKVNARIMSRKAAMSDMDNKYVGDYDLAWKEWEKEIEIKAVIPKEAEAKINEKYGLNQPAESNSQTVAKGEGEDGRLKANKDPQNPANKVDNRAAGKSIQQR